MNSPQRATATVRNAMPRSPTVKSAARRHHALIDVLRGAACLAVVLFHSLTAFNNQPLHPVLRDVLRITDYGWLGVSVFFALSGWCIAERISAGWIRKESPVHFLTDRCLRILPVYWCALALLIASRVAAAPFNSVGLSTLGLQSAGQLSLDVTLAAPLLGRPTLLVVAWTLTYELLFYAAAAAALGIRARGIGATALLWGGVVALGVPLILWPLDRTAALHAGCDFLAGAAAWRAATAHSVRSRAAGWGALAMVVAALAISGALNLPRVIALATAALLAATLPVSPWIASLRVLRPLAWLGLISYSLYLVHVIVLSPVNNLGTRFVAATQGGFIVVWLLGVSAAIAVGWMFYRLVEAPCERWRRARMARPSP